MQTINIDGTTYKLKFDRDPMEIMKLARKPYKQKKHKDIRKFPKCASNWPTAVYIREFDRLNMLRAVAYIGASETSTAQYDPSIPLFEILPDAEA
jgi:hypothetical protein